MLCSCQAIEDVPLPIGSPGIQFYGRRWRIRCWSTLCRHLLRRWCVRSCRTVSFFPGTGHCSWDRSQNNRHHSFPQLSPVTEEQQRAVIITNKEQMWEAVMPMNLSRLLWKSQKSLILPSRDPFVLYFKGSKKKVELHSVFAFSAEVTSVSVAA